MLRPLKRWETVPLIIPAGSTASRFNYPDIPQLRDDTTQDIIIRGLQCFSVENMPASPANVPVATTAQLINSFLTLYIDGEEQIHQLPLINLQNVFQALATGTSQQTYGVMQLENVKIDWNKSFIEVATPYNNETAFAIVIGVEYKKLPPGAYAIMTKGRVPGW